MISCYVRNEVKSEGSIKSQENNKEQAEPSDGNEMKFMSNPLSPSSLQGDFMFPDELNYNLRLQINNLTAENGALRRSLREKETVLENVAFSSPGESIQSGLHSRHWSAIGVGRASELAASKIVELSKRVRELTAELETEKRRGRGRATKEEDVGREEEGGIKRGPRKCITKKQGATSGQQDEDREIVDKMEVKTLKEKLSATSTKLSEWRNQCQVLKQELKLADKILASEVGDGTTLETIKTSIGAGSPLGSVSSSWRGRAQQLSLLRAKVIELQEKLKKAEAMSQEGLNGQENMDEKENNSKREREMRAAELKGLEASLQETERRASEWKRKSEVSRARSAAKQAEIEALKSRLTTVLTKAEHDDQLITSLTECLKNKECTIRDKESEIKAEMEEHKKEREDLTVQLMKEQAKANNLEDILDKKNLMVEKLQQTIQDMAVAAESRENKPMHYDALTSSYSKSSEHEFRVVIQTTEAERLRLMELVAVLNKRLKEEQSQTDQTLKQLKIEKRKNAILETKVAFLELESTSGRNNSYYKSSTRKNSSNSNKQAIPDDIKHRLEFLEEEKIVLESRIECLKQEKEDDLKHYSTMLRETRGLFHSQLEAIECNTQQNDVRISKKNL